MANVRITFEYNEMTGRREINIDYESDSSTLPFEHENEHRKIAEKILNLKALQDSDYIEEERTGTKNERLDEIEMESNKNLKRQLKANSRF
ncbi:MAG: hypothetical protein HQK78_17845 [Desulfobacterales bacterium]|nr:hypothetical protein [Desulfobacterales bacterium]